MTSRGATAEEVAAIVAALAVIERERQAAGALSPGSADPGAGLDAWVRASRLSGRRAGLVRGPWRLSGRIGRRSQA